MTTSTPGSVHPWCHGWAMPVTPLQDPALSRVLMTSRSPCQPGFSMSLGDFRGKGTAGTPGRAKTPVTGLPESAKPCRARLNLETLPSCGLRRGNATPCLFQRAGVDRSPAIPILPRASLLGCTGKLGEKSWIEPALQGLFASKDLHKD